MSIKVKAENPCFAGLTNKYTGEPIEVLLVSAAGSNQVYFMAPGTPTPARWHTSLDKLYALATSRNGLVGATSPEKGAMICPYSGKQMSLEHDVQMGFRLVGGWDPAMPLPSASEFAALARGEPILEGKKTSKTPDLPSVTVSTNEPEEPLRKPKTEPDAPAMDTAERVVHRLRQLAKE